MNFFLGRKPVSESFFIPNSFGLLVIFVYRYNAQFSCMNYFVYQNKETSCQLKAISKVWFSWCGNTWALKQDTCHSFTPTALTASPDETWFHWPPLVYCHYRLPTHSKLILAIVTYWWNILSWISIFQADETERKLYNCLEFCVLFRCKNSSSVTKNWDSKRALHECSKPVVYETD